MIKSASKLILGTAQFGLNYGINNSRGKPTNEEVQAILGHAFDKGVVSLDTAEAYGDAQERIGEFHKNSNKRFNVITKYSSKIDLPAQIGFRVEHNLRTLNIDKLYSYMFHSIDDYKLHFPLFQTDLAKMISTDLISKIGVSVYTNDEALQILNDDSIRLIQMPFNLLDNINKRKYVLETAKKRGVEVHTRSVFLQGLFFKDIISLPENLKDLELYLNYISFLQEKYNIKVQDLALNYVVKQDLISKVLLGVDNIEQLDVNLNSLQSHFSESIMKDVNGIDIISVKLLNPVNWK